MDEIPLSALFTRPILPDRCCNRNFLDYCFTDTYLRSCSVSIQEQADKSEREHLKRVVQFSLTVFPKSAAFIDPSKGTLDNPAFWQDGKGVEFTALNNHNICARKSVNGVGKIFSGIASIYQNLFEHRQVIGYITIIINHINSSVSVSYIGSCHHDCMGQPQNIHSNMQFYSRYFFPAS